MEGIETLCPKCGSKNISSTNFGEKKSPEYFRLNKGHCWNCGLHRILGEFWPGWTKKQIEELKQQASLEPMSGPEQEEEEKA